MINEVPMTILGALDTLAIHQATGWAFSPDRRDPLTVQAILDHRVIGQAVADQHRADLAALGLRDGQCGYVIKFYSPIEPCYLPFVSVKLAEGDLEFPRTPTCGYAEFGSSLYRQRPMTGRPRSIFGGLWTDRTDASACLRARLAIGQIPETAAPALTALITEGACRLDGIDPKTNLLTDREINRLLRLILEDEPVALSTTSPKGTAEPFIQPSAREPLVSPGECLLLITPATTKPATVSILRDSHTLPEFTPSGASRYLHTTPPPDSATLSLHPANTMPLAQGQLALVGPGTIFATSGPTHQTLIIPAHHTAAAMLRDQQSASVTTQPVILSPQPA